ncbi:MAG: curli assembly protein CsgF [Hydrogenophilaceae bacterium]
MKRQLAIFLGLALGTLCGAAAATEIIYTPVNPSFGGSPLNGSWLLNSALAQQDEADSGQTPTSALELFNQSLQRSILSRISSAVSSGIVDPSTGSLVPGTLETTDFIIEIVDLGGGLLKITTTDKVTNQSTSFEVSSAI